MASKTIDLGSKPMKDGGPMAMDAKPSAKVYYPSVYISGVSGTNFPLGKISFMAEGEVVSCKKDGCEIEIHSITPKSVAKKDAGDGLDEALGKIEADKEPDPEDPNEEMEGENE